MKSNELKTGTITDINERLMNDIVFSDVVKKIDRLSESQLNRANDLIDLFFIEPLKDDK